MFTSSFYTNSILPSLPPQMIPKSQKDKEWTEDCMDALEAVGRAQFRSNMRLIENYEMVKGKFIPGHYFDQPDYQDLIGQLQREFEVPSYLRHYDIISQVINTLSGEWLERPDIFMVKAMDEKTQNEYVRTKTDLLQKYVMGNIEAEVARKLMEMGMDPNREDFQSEEEMAQFQQTIEQAKKQLTPPQIEEYMSTSWFTAAEMWGQHQLNLNKQRFNLKMKEKKELEDMLISDRCFRHFYITASGHNEETWNPVNTFFHKSPDVEYVEEGDYVGRVFWLTIPAIIDRYGHLMTAKQLKSLQESVPKKDKRWNYSAGSEYVFDQYMVPFKDYPTYDIIRQTQGFQNQSDSNLPYLDSNFFSSLYSGKYFNESKGYYFVVEAYWKSQEKLIQVCYLDPETGQKVKMFLDEDVEIPKNFKILDSSLYDSADEPNTAIETWVNRVYKGIKICIKNHDGNTDDLYLDVKPNEFQFKGDLNIYDSKLPVCGEVFSPRNSESMSLVDLMKPHQIGYNVAMNQLYQIMQREVGRFLVMDVNMFADVKDWGGSNAYEKFMLIAKELGVTVVDTSPANTQGAQASAGGHLPREFNLDESARMMSRLKIAEAFEMFALKQIGFNEYRLGNMSSSSTATGIQEGQARSFAQTESYFTKFSNYLKRCYRMGLDISQYVQSQEKDVTVMYTKSDMSRAFIKMNGMELSLSDLHVYVSNSQEDKRQLEALRQLAMSNNTMGATFKDLAEVITANSPAEIMRKLEVSDKKHFQMLEQEQQIKQQQIQEEAKAEEARLAEEARQFDTEWGEGGTRERIAYMTTFNRQEDNNSDEDMNGIPDVLEYDKLAQKAESDDSKVQVQKEKNQIQREKNMGDQAIARRKLEVEDKKIAADLEIQRSELESVKILKKKADAAKKPPAKKKSK
jgi:hypothetical protein